MRTNVLRIEWLPNYPHPNHPLSDIVIDGTRLQNLVERVTHRSYDMTTPIGFMPEQYQKEWAARLMADGQPDLPTGRCELLVCAECGHLGCGCISCSIRRDDDSIIWSDLGWETDYGELNQFPMGSFRFKLQELKSALSMV